VRPVSEGSCRHLPSAFLMKESRENFATQPVKIGAVAADIFEMVMPSPIESAVRQRVLTYKADKRSARTSVHPDIAALMVERDDGTCTVLWTGRWRAISSRFEQWPTRAAAMEAVTKVTGEILLWSELSPQTWTARAA